MANTISSRASYEALPFLPGAFGELLGCIGTTVAGLVLAFTAPSGGMQSIGAAAMAILRPALLIE